MQFETFFAKENIEFTLKLLFFCNVNVVINVVINVAVNGTMLCNLYVNFARRTFRFFKRSLVQNGAEWSIPRDSANFKRKCRKNFNSQF